MNNNLPEHFYKIEDEFLMDMLYGFDVKTKLWTLLDVQKGGGQITEHKWIDKGGIYTFRLLEYDNRISVLSSDDSECVTVLINNRQAILHNMSYHENCAKEGLRRPGGGSKLLRFTLNYLLNKKEKYGIKRVLLKDNSFIYCSNCSISLKLARLRVITHGKPWYSEYGFEPYNPENEKPDILMKDNITKNRLKFTKLRTHSIDLVKIIKKAIVQDELKDINITNLARLIKSYPLMKDFIVRLMKEYDTYCCVVTYIIDYIFKSGINNVYDLYGQVYYLELN